MRRRNLKQVSINWAMKAMEVWCALHLQMFEVFDICSGSYNVFITVALKARLRFDAWVTCSSITGLYQWCSYNGVVLCFPVLCCVVLCCLVLCCSARSSSQEGGGRCHQLHSPQGNLEASSKPESTRSNQRLPAGLLQTGERGASWTAHDRGHLLPWSSG